MTDELYEATAVRIASYQQRLTNLYNMHVKLRAFRTRDLVLRRVFENTTDLMAGKFQPNWEGSYVIVKVGPAGSYALNRLDGAPMPKMWNAMHLKGIINKAFFKEVINKISFKVFSFNPWNITNQVFFKGSISFNLWNNSHFKRPKVAHILLALSKDRMWL